MKRFEWYAYVPRNKRWIIFGPPVLFVVSASCFAMTGRLWAAGIVGLILCAYVVVMARK
jgi:hypothetical protein